MDNNIIFFLFQIIVLIFSVMIHEIAHGAVALKLGDTTARDAGRLTLNPIKHIDPFGSIILPLLLSIPALFGAPTVIFGWAKPVPYNPFNLKNPKRGAGIIGGAGPISNLLIAVIFSVLLRGLVEIEGFSGTGGIILFFNIIIFINILLAIFNLMPLPPLDGSNILFSLLPRKYYFVQEFLMRYGTILLLLFIFFGFDIIFPVINGLYTFLAGDGAIF